MGLVATRFTVVFGLLVPVAGVAGDRFPRSRIVVLSLVVFGMGTLLTGLATGFLLLLLFGGVATGAGDALYAPAEGQRRRAGAATASATGRSRRLNESMLGTRHVQTAIGGRRRSR